MNKYIQQALLAMGVLLTSACALAEATVSYVNPGKMTDVPRNGRDRESMQAALLEHFNALSARLPAGQQLKVDIVDIDLAGDVFPRVAIQHVRVMKGRADYPRIDLRYSIEQDGKVISSGERSLTDTNYLTSFNRYSSDLYAHEKQLLDDWFRKELIAVR